MTQVLTAPRKGCDCNCGPHKRRKDAATVTTFYHIRHKNLDKLDSDEMEERYVCAICGHIDLPEVEMLAFFATEADIDEFERSEASYPEAVTQARAALAFRNGDPKPLADLRRAFLNEPAERDLFIAELEAGPKDEHTLGAVIALMMGAPLSLVKQLYAQSILERADDAKPVSGVVIH